MQCVEFELMLEQDADGSWPAEATAHLEGCPECHLLWDDLLTIRKAGQELGADAPEVPAYLWAGLRAQMEAEGLIRDTAAPGWLAGWFSRTPRLVLAGAYMAVLLAAVGLVSYRSDRKPLGTSIETANISGAPLMAGIGNIGSTLNGNSRRVMDSFEGRDVDLTESFQQNLGIVDNLIADCERSAREQPDDPIVREYLYGAYQQKAVLLATAMDRSTLEDR
jgi:hypothetical protein